MRDPLRKTGIFKHAKYFTYEIKKNIIALSIFMLKVGKVYVSIIIFIYCVMPFFQ